MEYGIGNSWNIRNGISKQKYTENAQLKQSSRNGGLKQKYSENSQLN